VLLAGTLFFVFVVQHHHIHGCVQRLETAGERENVFLAQFPRQTSRKPIKVHQRQVCVPQWIVVLENGRQSPVIVTEAVKRVVQLQQTLRRKERKSEKWLSTTK
jgi:hypothetical protein